MKLEVLRIEDVCDANIGKFQLKKIKMITENKADEEFIQDLNKNYLTDLMMHDQYGNIKSARVIMRVM